MSRWTVLFLVFALTALAEVCAEPPSIAPASTDPSAREMMIPMPDKLPADAMQLLNGVKDNVFSFDDPAFYWICRFVREQRTSLGANLSTDNVTGWRNLLERPGDYRGRRVVVEGLVLRTSAYDVTNRAGLSRLYQLDVGEADTRAIATVVLTRDPGELETRTRVRIAGYFVKVRSFETNKGETGSGPLVVGYACQAIPGATDAIPGYSKDQPTAMRWMYWVIALLAVMWFVLRGHLRRQRGRQIVMKVGGIETQNATSEEDLRWLLDREGRDLFE